MLCLLRSLCIMFFFISPLMRLCLVRARARYSTPSERSHSPVTLALTRKRRRTTPSRLCVQRRGGGRGGHRRGYMGATPSRLYVRRRGGGRGRHGRGRDMGSTVPRFYMLFARARVWFAPATPGAGRAANASGRRRAPSRRVLSRLRAYRCEQLGGSNVAPVGGCLELVDGEEVVAHLELLAAV